MANERRLIELIEQAGDLALSKHISLTSDMVAKHLVRNGVEVPVHCCECKYSRIASWGERCCSVFEIGDLSGDDYCSSGKKREVE